MDVSRTRQTTERNSFILLEFLGHRRGWDYSALRGRPSGVGATGDAGLLTTSTRSTARAHLRTLRALSHSLYGGRPSSAADQRMSAAAKWRREWDCCGRPGPRPFGPDAPGRASSKIAPGNFVEPACLSVRGFES